MNTTTTSAGTRMPNARVKAAMKDISGRPCFVKGHHRLKFPVGWIDAVNDMTRSLVALQKGNRDLENLVVYRITQLNNGHLFAEFNCTNQHSVNGILRKTQIRCQNTCQVCGAPGRRYAQQDVYRSWCPTCAAPALLLDDIARLDEQLKAAFSEPTFPVRKMPSGLRASFRAWVALHEAKAPGIRDSVGTWYAREWRAALRPLEAAVRKLRNDGQVEFDRL